MTCVKCGAEASGNYCCVCGRKIRNPLAEFRLAERRALKKMVEYAHAKYPHPPNDGFACIGNLMNACVYAARNSYSRLDKPFRWSQRDGAEEFYTLMMEKLDASNASAKLLFDSVAPLFEEVLDARDRDSGLLWQNLDEKRRPSA